MKNYRFLFIVILLAPVGILEASLLTRENLKGFIAHDNGTDTLQLTVPSQFGMQNGDASCGYQAIYNGRAIRTLLQLDDQARQEALQALKADTKSRETLFSSKESPWRAHVLATSKDCIYGNWLKSEELESLLINQAKVDIRTAFITGNNVLLPDSPLSEDPLLMTSPDFENFVTQFRSEKGSTTATFYVYLKGLKREATTISSDAKEVDVFKKAREESDEGHWICMVAHKVGNIRQFILADSASNTSRVEHYRIKELRALLLEGPAYATYADGRFAQWIAEARPTAPTVESMLESFRNSSPYKFSQQYPFSSGILWGVAVCCVAKFLIDTYTKRSNTTQYRSPETMPISDAASIAVH